jgi:NADP-dependent 3-hydroxy acid dehydrogenase YdfG
MSLAKYTNTVPMAGKTALVTGATSGIGEAIAWRFAAEGAKVIIAGRREERLTKLKADIEAEISGAQICPLKLDVTNTETVLALPGALPEGFRVIDVLVNNAGLALGKASVDMTLIEDITAMVQTNVVGLMALTTAVAKQMKERGVGHIISIGSISGHDVYPGGSVYCATKFAVDGYMKAVRADLLSTAVRVSVVSPGFVETEFSLVRFKGDGTAADAVYDGFVPLVAADIADNVLYVATRPAHVQIGEIVTWPTNQTSGGPMVARVGDSLGAANT